MNFEVAHAETTVLKPNPDEIRDTIRMITTRSGFATTDPNREILDENICSLRNNGQCKNDGGDLAICTAVVKQQSDNNIKLIIDVFKGGSRPFHSEVVAINPVIRHYWRIWAPLELHDECLYKRFYPRNGMAFFPQLIVPDNLKGQILYQMHNNILSGHGKENACGTLQRFYWYGMRDDIKQWSKSCLKCQVNKKPQKIPRAPLGGMQVGSPLDRLSTDFPVTPNIFWLLQKSSQNGSRYFLFPDQSATRCANVLLNEVIGRYGTPLRMHSVEGRNYESIIFKELCRLLEIKKTRSSIRNPKGNGQTERFSRTLLSMIIKYLKGEQKNWDLNLGCLASAYRATPQEATGLTPNLLMLSREVRQYQ